MVKVVLPLKKVYAIFFIFISLVLIGIGVYAYGTNSPSTMGHSMGEITPPCSGMLVASGGSWTCISANIPSCSGSAGITWTGSSWQCKPLV